jgi:hypothetical protein
LPDGKALIEREARYPGFNPNRFWRTVSTAHLLNRARFGIKLCFNATPIAPQLRKMIAPGKPAASADGSADGSADKPPDGANSGPHSPEKRSFSALRVKGRLDEKSDEPVS